MDRKEFLKNSLVLGGCCCVASPLVADEASDKKAVEAAAKVQRDKTFTDNWLTDLLAAMDSEIPEEARARLMACCGAGCYRRHKFKQDIAAEGRGDVAKLVTAYKKTFGEGVKVEGDTLHVRFNSAAHGCYCPVLNGQDYASKKGHCDCTRGTHEALVSEALGRPVKGVVVESVRRGGQCCHIALKIS